MEGNRPFRSLPNCFRPIWQPAKPFLIHFLNLAASQTVRNFSDHVWPSGSFADHVWQFQSFSDHFWPLGSFPDHFWPFRSGSNHLTNPVSIMSINWQVLPPMEVIINMPWLVLQALLPVLAFSQGVGWFTRAVRKLLLGSEWVLTGQLMFMIDTRGDTRGVPPIMGGRISQLLMMIAGSGLPWEELASRCHDARQPWDKTSHGLPTSSMRCPVIACVGVLLSRT